MFRGAAICLIYDRSLIVPEDGCDKAAAVSLMSNDVDQIAFCLEELNECWSRLIELCVGIPLLAFQLGWVSVVPFLVVICKPQKC
jgi:ATP-binding cassette subfamily C (CFTR/MRP) protein 1